MGSSQKVNNSAQGSGKSYRSLAPAVLRELDGYEHLCSLLKESSRSTVLTLERFEMLEAELRNQAILNFEPDKMVLLSQLLSIERNLLRWRARRAGIDNESIQFSVDVPRYIAKLTYELAASLGESDEMFIEKENSALSARRLLWKACLTTGEQIRAELRYLEQFAAYLNGSFDASTSKFQKGLSLVLRVIAEPEESPRLPYAVVLPTTARQLVGELLQARL